MARAKKTAPTKAAILRELAREDLRARYAVRKVALFGSFATGNQTDRSDIDLLVDFADPTYDNFIGLIRELEKSFGRKVEVLTPVGLESIRVPSVARSIRRALVYG